MQLFSGTRDQLGKLQRLAQPYFLPLEEDGRNGWQFLLLVVALVAVVVGLTLLLLTGVLALSGAVVPELQSRFLPGVPQQVAAIWQGPIGAVVMVLFLAGAACFWAFRGRLRQIPATCSGTPGRKRLCSSGIQAPLAATAPLSSSR